MHGTVDIRRFLWLVFLFVFSILLLVFSGNFFVTMVGWDGLGLVSFCLVIYYINSSSLESGLITVFRNRIGDVFFLASFFFFMRNGVFSWDLFSVEDSFLFLLFLFLGAITKRAQIPFSAWLPAAMAAPTPVSSLVHSSTLVTAGVYVLIRFNYLFRLFSFSFLRFFFVFTILIAGASAVLERDFKKIVAISTLSQLGIMMFILSVGGWLLSFLHIIIHAFFKSMLFLSTGSLIGQIAGTQDSRFYGGSLSNYSSFLNFIVRSLCLCGFPFFLGFYSKDFIISSSSFLVGVRLYFLFIIGCFFTVAYRVRLVFKSYCVMYKYTSFLSTEEDINFFIPVSILFLKCWIFGGFIYWFFLSGINFFFTFLDLFVGLILFFFGVTFYFFLRFLYQFFFRLSIILFLRWEASSGTSFLFRRFRFFSYETTWMETLGGGGTFFIISRAGNTFDYFRYMGIGIFLFVLVFVTFLYC